MHLHHHHDHDHHHHHHRRLPGHIVRGLVIAAVVLVVLLRSFYTARETEYVLITEFGKPLYAADGAGLHAKWFWQSATRLDKRTRLYSSQPSEFLTRDKKNLVVEPYVAWKIEDPRRFIETVGDEGAAEMRLHDVVWSGLAAALGQQELQALVSPAPEAVRTSDLLDRLTEATGVAALRQYGVRIVDVRIRRLNLPEQNKQAVFARMRAERERIARQYRAEGEEQALRIRADADRQKEEILSAAYRDAERVKGEGDADSTRIYSQAYSKNPRFYKLLRTLEAYKKILDDKTTAILSSDSELLRVLTKGESAQ